VGRGSIVFIVIGVVLVGGTIAAVIWWQLADVLFPGTARKTGQTILGGKKKPEGPPPGATVIKGFDEEK
jgi:hypothetical protein